MCPWEYTAVWTRSVDHLRSSSRAARANSWLPVSTRTSPSPVEMALTLANDGTNAFPSPTSATPPRGAKGWACSRTISPRHRRSATSRTSRSSGMFRSRRRHRYVVEHQRPRHVDAQEHDQGEKDGLDAQRRAEVLRYAGGEGDDHYEHVEDDRRQRLDLPQRARRCGNWRELQVGEDDGARRCRQGERNPPHGAVR